MQKLNVAIVGVTGAVGEELLSILAARRFPVGNLRALASARSAGKELDTPLGKLRVEEATPASFAGIDVAFFSAGAGVSRELAPAAVAAGAVVIDNTSAFRMDPGVPLVVPEVNPEEIRKHQGIIANPNCSTIIMVLVLKPLHDRARLKRVVVSTYQAVSGAGARAMAALREESEAYLAGREVKPQVLPFSKAERHYQIAFNVIPQIDVFAEDAYTKEEWKMVRETQKIMGEEDLRITATTVRVPVFRSHSEALNLEFMEKITAAEAREILSRAPGVVVSDDPPTQLYPMPILTSGLDPVYVGRIREDKTVPSGLNLWVVGDQIRKGAALNAVQIAEQLFGLERV